MDLIPLSKDAIHIYVAFACLVAALFVLRLPSSSFKALIPGLVVTTAMELLDLRDDLAALGVMRFGASLKDLVNANVLPLLAVLLARRRVE